MKREEEAVSPVLGVLLLVAITIVLAAFIAAFMFGMVGQVHKSKNVGITAYRTGDNLILTVQGGIDIDHMDSLTTRLYNKLGADPGAVMFSHTEPRPTDGWYAGYQDSCSPTSGTVWDHAVVTATFDDGTEQVVLDQGF